MTDQLRILHLEDSSNDAELVRAELARAGVAAEWQRVETRDTFVAALDSGACSLILCDYHLPSFDGLSALAIAHDKCPEIPFIFVSGAIAEQLAITALTSGATDYVYKSNLKRLAPVVKRAIGEARLQREQREHQAALQQLVDDTSALTGHAFIRTLVRNLAAMLHTQYAFIGLIADPQATRVRTLALWTGGDFAANFEYALEGTPCQNVVGQSECFYAEDVQRRFPRDHLLAEMNIESYHGVPLFRGDGTPLGLLSVFDTRPMADLIHLRPLLRMCASRAAAELERTETEQTLQESQKSLLAANQRLEMLLQSSPLAIYTRDADGLVTSWNPSAEKMYGWSANEVLGRPLPSVADDQRADSDALRKRLLAGEPYIRHEVQRQRRDGSLIDIDVFLGPLRDGAGNITGIVTVVADITERKRAERERERKAALTALLEALARTANEATTPEAALRVCIEHICAYGRWTLGHAALYAPGQTSGRAQTSLWHGQEQKRYEEIIRLSNEYAFNKRHGGFVGAALSMRKPVWVEDLSHAAGFGRLAVIAKSGLRAGFVFPVVAGGEIAAFLEFFADAAHAPDTLLLEAIGNVSSLLARLIERHRSEAALLQLAAIVETSPDAIISRNLEGTVLSWNAGAERIYGYSAQEMTGRDINVLVPPSTDRTPEDNNERLLKGETLPVYETVRLTKDGRRIHVEISISAIRDAAGRVTQIAAIHRDVTASRQAAADRARLAAIIEGSDDAIFSRTLDGVVTSWNTGAERMFGYAADEAIGQRVEELILPPEAHARVANNVDRVRHGERVAAYETRRMAKDGRMIDVLSSVSPIRNDAGEVVGVSVILHDISALKQAEAAVRDKERLFRSTIEHAEIGITHLSLDGHYLLVNPKFCQVTGFTEQELRPKNIAELIYHEDLAGFRADRQQLLANLCRSVTSERRYQRKDGALIWVHCTLSLIRTSEGDLQHLLHIVEDITPRRQAEAAIRESEERFHAAFEQAGVGMGLRDIDPLKPRWLRVNQKLCDILGYTREELLQLTSFDLTPPEDRDTAIDYNQRLLRGKIRNYTREKRYVRKDGRIIWVNLTMSGVYDPDGRAIYIVSVLEDITQSKLAALALQESEEQFRQLATNIPEVFWIIDGATGAIAYVSPAFETIWGRACDDFRNNPAVWTDAIHPEDRERMSVDGEVITRSGKKKDYRIVRPDGAIRWIHDQSFPVMENGRLQRIIGIAEDITERKENEARMLHLAHYDGLTDLPNRVLFRDRLQQALVQAQRNDWLIGVLIIGIDRFKNINDTYGHETGDKVLQEVGRRIVACTRLGDTAGRFGGDEFGLILSNLGAAEDASLVAQKITDRLAQPLPIDGTETYLSASIGITLYPEDSQHADALIRDANAALRRAKELGRNNVQFYKTEMNARAKIKLGLETSLRRALDNNEFLLHYQPKVALLTGEISGFEALLRWQRPDQGMVSPADFVPLLEETGLILPVGDWVLRTACAQARHWRDSGHGAVPIAVNLSVRQFQQPDLDQHLLKIINESGVEPDLLELEITESFLMHNPEEAAQTLTRLRDAGIRISVDDFGTGYSSLSYLSRFPIDSVKIDRSFIRDVTQNPENAAIARAVIGLAHNLGMKSVAEGVETVTQLGFLSTNDCDEIQGYFFSRPLPAAECSRMLEDGRRLTAHIRSRQTEQFTVLLVDDEEHVLEALERVLRRDGYRILTAKSAAAGLDLLATHEVGVVISDERMPDMTGVDFQTRVCKMYPHTIRMVLTGYADMQAIIAAINDGAVFKFLQKPWDNAALRASVREAFRLYRLNHPEATGKDAAATPSTD